MRMYELTEMERQALISLLRDAKVNILTEGEIDEALEILGDFQEERNDSDESECE